MTTLLASLVLAAAVSSPVAPDTSTTLRRLRSEAEALRPIAASKLSREFLAAVARLPSMAPRTVAFDSSRTRWWSSRDADTLAASERTRLMTRTLGESFYWQTRYGSPLAYVRALDVVADAGLAELRGRRVLDFGYGTVGHLRLMAELGASVTGIEVDPLLRVFYSEPGDQGAMGARGGRVQLLNGRWPGEDPIRSATGGGYDLFLSKNTLKNGYIHPAEKVDPARLVHLGVGDTAFVQAMASVLKPGGLALLYNLCPAPAPPGKPYIPWADGRSPFTRELFEREGFEVLEFDREDSPAARKMGHALGWDDPEGGKMDLEHDLFGTYTLLRKRSR